MKRLWSRRLSSAAQRGSVLVYTLIVTVVLATLISGIATSAARQRVLSDRHQLYTRELAAAEYAVNKTFGDISYSVKKAGLANVSTAISNTRPPEIPGMTISDFAVTVKSDATSVLPAGHKWAGYNLRSAVCEITANAKETDSRYDHPGVTLQQEFEITYIPLYVFGIFYANNLEMHPGADFTESGRVHTNANLYYGSDGHNMGIENYLSAVGDVNYGRHPHSGKTLDEKNAHDSFWNGTQLVEAKDSQGKRLGHSYNGADGTWAEVAEEKWGDYVRDSAMGVTPLNLPWPEVVPNMEVIQPKKASDFGPLKEQKLVYKAGLLITRSGGNTTAKRSDGSNVSLTYKEGGVTKSVVSTGGFYNERQGGNITTLDIDLAGMQKAGITPGNGIVYVENQNANGAVRLINGEDLPGSQGVGFTLATPQPLYVQGDYNSVNSTLSMLACDAINILSEDWADSENTQSKRNNNGAPKSTGDLTMNAVVVAGNVPTELDSSNGKHYSGGVENFFRYLEKWTGAGTNTHHFVGSIINLYGSEKAREYWEKQKYQAPTRDWDWDPRLATQGPPGSPVTFETIKSRWSIKSN